MWPDDWIRINESQCTPDIFFFSLQTRGFSFVTGFTPVVYGLLHYAFGNSKWTCCSAKACFHQDEPGGVVWLRISSWP